MRKGVSLRAPVKYRIMSSEGKFLVSTRIDRPRMFTSFDARSFQVRDIRSFLRAIELIPLPLLNESGGRTAIIH